MDARDISDCSDICLALVMVPVAEYMALGPEDVLDMSRSTKPKRKEYKKNY